MAVAPVSLAGSPNLCQLPGQEQPFPAAWAPPVGLAPQAPPAGLQRAPCGCCFHPQLFHIPWTSTHLPPLATATLGRAAASLPGAALWGPGGCRTPPAWAAHRSPQGQPQHLPPYTQQGRAVTPAPPLLPTSIPSYQQIQGQPAETKTSGSATPRAAPLGSNIPPGSDIPPSPSAAPHEQALGDPTGDLAVAEEVLLEEALRLFGCSPDAVGVSQDAPSSGPRPGDPGGTGAAIPHCDFASLSLPEELLSPDYSVPETADAILSLDEFVMGLEPQEPWGDEGRDLPPSQPATAEKRGKKRAKSTSPKPASKRRALAGSTGVAGGCLDPQQG
ncbi:proline-rich protein 22-like [Gavia stellata]|uniref:proline-rich protein 22-like n=1 Tax=Gavia stellata TaxID=37040 RepID=UPI002896EF6A|nr:proline-rich protein 22-like [Gavia stellata]